MVLLFFVVVLVCSLVRNSINSIKRSERKIKFKKKLKKLLKKKKKDSLKILKTEILRCLHFPFVVSKQPFLEDSVVGKGKYSFVHFTS